MNEQHAHIDDDLVERVHERCTDLGSPDAVRAILQAAQAEVDADHERYVQQQVSEARIAGWNINGDGMDLRVAMARETAAILVTAAKTFLDATNATNYVEQHVIDRETGDRYTLTIQRPGGKTPHEMRRAAEQERDELRAEAQRLRGEVERLRGLLADDDPRHIIEFRADGWTIKHPLSCRPNLFACQVSRVAEADLTAPPAVLGRFECGLNDLGDRLLIGDSVDGYDTATAEDHRVQTDPPRLATAEGGGDD